MENDNLNEIRLDAAIDGLPIFLEDELGEYRKVIITSKKVEINSDKISISYYYKLSEKIYYRLERDREMQIAILKLKRKKWKII